MTYTDQAEWAQAYQGWAQAEPVHQAAETQRLARLNAEAEAKLFALTAFELFTSLGGKRRTIGGGQCQLV